jgi:hypothetical protein
VNILDENILKDQRQLLRSWRIQARQIGHDIGRKGLQDEEIIRLLLRLRRPTLFTRDLGFYDRHLCHTRYCVACLAVDKYEAAIFLRRVLSHRALNTQAKRMGTVIRATHRGLSVWRLRTEEELFLAWAE